jgi:hypothetical protein
VAIPWESLLQGVRHYLRLQLLGVLAPGAILLLELGFLSLPSGARRSPIDALRYMSSQTGGLSTPVALIAIALALVAAYVIGFLIRQAMWRVLLWRSKEPEWNDIRAQVCTLYRTESVDEVLRDHPALRLDAGASSVGARRYCKAWLQLNEPMLSVDHLESEVNILFAYVVPLAIAPFVVLQWWLATDLLYWLLATAMGCLIGLLVARTGTRLRDDVEPYDTIINFLLAHWLRPVTSEMGPGSGKEGAAGDSAGDVSDG